MRFASYDSNPPLKTKKATLSSFFFVYTLRIHTLLRLRGNLARLQCACLALIRF